VALAAAGLATLLFAIAFAAVTAFFLLVMVAAASGAEQLGVMALLGGFTATFALPQIGVKIDADSRYAVSTQVTVFWSVCRSTAIVASTGVTSDWSSA